MLAAVFHGRNDVRLREVPDPAPPRPGWITVKVLWCGICGTDVEEVSQGPTIVPRTPNPLTGRALPLTLGHEGTGTVIARGDGVDLRLGERVSIEGTITCGECRWCRDGRRRLCPSIAGVGFMLDGALAEYVTVPASMCVALPAGMSDEAGAFAEPLSVVIRAIHRAHGVSGRSVIVVGGSTIGLLAAQAARAEGASSVRMRVRSALRHRTAAALALDVLEPTQADRADVVIECTNTADGFQSAIDSTDRGGVTVIVGIHVQPRGLDALKLVLEEREVTSALAHTVDDDFRPAVAMLADGRVRVDPLISARVPLARVVEDGFAPLLSAPQHHTKILIDCRV